MNITVVSSCEWTYPDIHSYASGSQCFSGAALTGGFASFQLHISSCGEAVISVSGFEAEVYEQLPVAVESNPGFEKEAPHFPERRAPFFVNDCLRPVKAPARLSPRMGSVGVYIAVLCKKSGTIRGFVTVCDGEEKAEVPVEICVCSAPLPDESLQIVMGVSMWEAAKRHGVSFGTDSFAELETEYFRALRRQHQNRLYIDQPRVRKTGKDKYEFDYSEFNRKVKKALSMGFHAFHIGGIGFRRAWDAPDIEIHGMDSLSWEAYLYLSQYMLSLKGNIAANGWNAAEMFSIGIADEPNDADSLTYRAVCSMVRSLFPEIRIYDATSDVPTYGAIDIWVPRSDEYEKNRGVFDYYRSIGNDVWFYVCLYPRENGYINRFLDIPLLATRYLYWGAYRYGLTGYLHWTVNDYQDSGDPLLVSCPVHINAGSKSILPPGDDKMLYPGDEGKPYISMRLENQRESAEEYEMLKAISAVDKKLADSLCARGLRSFSDVSYESLAFERLHREIIESYEKAMRD